MIGHVTDGQRSDYHLEHLLTEGRGGTCGGLHHWRYFGIYKFSHFLIIIVSHKIFVNFAQNQLTVVRVAAAICEYLN